MNEAHSNDACPYALTAQLTKVLNSLPDNPSRKIATLHACSIFLHTAAFELLPQSDPKLAGDLIAMSNRLEMLLAAHNVTPFDPYLANAET